MRGFAPQVTCGNKPIGTELLLQSQVPIMNRVGIHVIRNGKVHCTGGKFRVYIGSIRKWVSSRIIPPWIVQSGCWAVYSHVAAPWRCDGAVDEELSVHKIIGQAISGANDCFAVTIRVP